MLVSDIANPQCATQILRKEVMVATVKRLKR
jgi:hypothetical protein